jgi:tetratricopeptide (TPR) repeat protein
MRAGRNAAAAALALLMLFASCAKKPAVAPAAPGTPKFADFVYPAGPAALGDPGIWDQQRAAWGILQSGDTRAADRQFAAILKQAPAFYPAEAGLGYASLARKDGQGALAHFEKALGANASYAPALAGKGEALLSLGRSAPALEAFEAAIAADPSLSQLRGRVDVLKFRGIQQNIESARKAAEKGNLDDARQGYLAAIAASPESAFLYRELAGIEHTSGDNRSALVHAEQAVKLDAADARALALIAEIHEANGDWAKAGDAYAALNAVEPGDATAAKIDLMREKAAFDTMPPEYRSIETSPSVTRAQLAALLGARLDDLLRRARGSNAVLMTDVRGSWAAPWIMAVARAGVMEAFPNHTFQPSGPVRRVDLAQAASRVLSLIAAEKPRLAAKWRDAHPRFSDVSPTHLAYAAAAQAVSAGVMSPLEGESFQLTRAVSGAEALDTVTKLQTLAKR